MTRGASARLRWPGASAPPAANCGAVSWASVVPAGTPSAAIRSQLAYPASFALQCLGQVIVQAGDLVAVTVLFGHIDAMAGFTVDEVLADPIGANTKLGHYTHFGNLLDLCAVVVPAGLTSDGRPAALMILGPALADDRILALAAELSAQPVPVPPVPDRPPDQVVTWERGPAVLLGSPPCALREIRRSGGAPPASRPPGGRAGGAAGGSRPAGGAGRPARGGGRGGAAARAAAPGSGRRRPSAAPATAAGRRFADALGRATR